MKNWWYRFSLITISLLMGACGQRVAEVPLPTQVDPALYATAVIMTREAPPVGFDTVAFQAIDANTDRLSGWRATLSMTFDGVFARTTRPATFALEAEIFHNATTNARRVVASLNQTLVEGFVPYSYDAVRLGTDFFLVRDGVCITNAPDDARVATELSAGGVLGGVQHATTAYQRATINSQSVWRYAFQPQDLALPMLTAEGETPLLSVVGELWVAPEHNATIRYFLALEVENVRIFGGTLPVSGTLNIRYELHDIGITPNISVPFGC